MPFSVLLVDDSPSIRRALRIVFEQNPDCVVCGEACDGHEAIDKAHRLQPDLVILDLSMPRMNGLDAARALKRVRPAIRLLMFTSFKTAQLEDAALAAGCVAVFDKSELYLMCDSIQQLVPAQE